MNKSSNDYRYQLNCNIRRLDIARVNMISNEIGIMIDIEQRIQVTRRAITAGNRRAAQLGYQLVETRWYQYQRRGDIAGQLATVKDTVIRNAGALDILNKQLETTRGKLEVLFNTIARG